MSNSQQLTSVFFNECVDLFLCAFHLTLSHMLVPCRLTLSSVYHTFDSIHLCFMWHVVNCYTYDLVCHIISSLSWCRHYSLLCPHSQQWIGYFTINEELTFKLYQYGWVRVTTSTQGVTKLQLSFCVSSLHRSAHCLCQAFVSSVFISLLSC